MAVRFERREFPRVSCLVEAMMISNGHFFHDIVVNVSEDGAQVEIKSPVSIGRDILLKARLGSLNFSVIGEIKWQNGTARRIGVQFLYLPNLLRRKIRSMAAKGLKRTLIKGIGQNA